MHNDTQDVVFSEVEPLIQSFIDGFNVCIFAYGQTGSGKTHTMIGEGGIVSRSADMVFRNARDLLTQMSCYEIHIEMVRDLLFP